MSKLFDGEPRWLIEASHAPDNTVTMRLAGDFDARNAPHIAERLTSYLVPEGRLELDCSGVTFLDSAALRSLVTACKAQTNAGGLFRIPYMSTSMRRVVEITGLDQMFNP